MTASDLRQKYLNFFIQKGHQVTPSASLIPEEKVEAAGAQKVLFTTAGMHPLIPFFLGEPHSKGKRLVNCQICLRTDDIDEVGDKVHHTFFEMLGNWSLGDYFKKEAIEWSFEFLTSENWLGIDKHKLAISVFAGDQDAPFDEESYTIWLKLGIPESRIAKLPKKNNWWGPAGEIGPCGPDTEMFVWTGEGQAPQIFNPDNPAWIEAWNDVFMEYNKIAEGKFELLKQKNVDTGMGLERMLAVLNGLDDDYRTDLFWPIIEKLEEISGKKYLSNPEAFRIISDHLKAVTFLADEGLRPSNKQEGYIMRRLIRRTAIKMRGLGLVPFETIPAICQKIIDIYGVLYFKNKCSETYPIIESESEDFIKALDWWVAKEGVKLLQNPLAFNGKLTFDLYQNRGFPLEVILDLLEQTNQKIDSEKIRREFNEEFKKHQELSRTSSVGMFKGGLVEHSEQTTRYHTATHLLHQALREVLGLHVKQAGSNITEERLRFDFTHPQKMTGEETKKVEDLVNQKIKENLPVKMETMSYDEAVESGALAFFAGRYGEQVKVYSIGDPSSLRSSGQVFSKEVCGGPHVDFTGKLGHFKIKKEESTAKGVRRIYAILK